MKVKKLSVETFMRDGAQQAAAFLRLLSNENRLLILCLLLQHKELSAGALNESLDLTQPALSQHLSKLREEGLITYRREAQTLYYRIANPDVAKLIDTLKTIFCP
ncbi:transcriptional regulator [Saccharophagus sp. K07]|jgi:DNA-binding transcriptional ArsR family regulator|uniref:ArsR/SmtB family transcription factor n=1 Tax=Saccharophagus sp. K07 TaxID=2283636 RepID=UPI0016524AD5|nr:metalloregulator ArsR/SmtB family transcription factor [Saccharophagus sp. K07]MBC6906846.1 transcriptional regulator [Saccharophagus sp. K07]